MSLCDENYMRKPHKPLREKFLRSFFQKATKSQRKLTSSKVLRIFFKRTFFKKGIYKTKQSVYNDKVKIKSKKRKKPSKVFQESRRRGLKAGANIIGLCAFEMPMGT